MKVLVTGGGGFLGSAIVARLLDAGYEVHTLARSDYPALRERGAETHQGDIAHYASVDQAARGCDAIVHAAAKAGVWGPYIEYYDTNVVGTQNVINACKRHGISKLVHTSTPSVAFHGTDQEGVDERTPYPTKYLAAYPKTKAIAEQMVLQANGAELATVALRPHLIWGPGDTQLGPRLIERARAGKLRLVGSGRQKVDATYVDNAAQGHALALERLAPDAACAGNAYYITNDEPTPIAEVVNRILGADGLPECDKRIGAQTAYAVGAALEWAYRALGKRDEPPMTRFVAKQLATAHWYDIGAAREDLEYTPIVSMDEGFARLRAALLGVEPENAD